MNKKFWITVWLFSLCSAKALSEDKDLFSVAAEKYAQEKDTEIHRKYMFDYLPVYIENWKSVLLPCRKSEKSIGVDATIYLIINSRGYAKAVSDVDSDLVNCVLKNLEGKVYPKHAGQLLAIKNSFKH